MKKKRIVSHLTSVAAVLFVCGVLAVAADASTGYSVGDLNLDGEVSAGDLTDLSRSVADISPLLEESYVISNQGGVYQTEDVNLSGEADAADLTDLACHVGGIEALLGEGTVYPGVLRAPGTSEGLHFERNEEGTGYIVVSVGDCADTQIVIPATYNGLPVTAIGDEAFYDTPITSVVIPEGVTRIGERAFSTCTQLHTVRLPDSLREIDAEAFLQCAALVDMELPDKVTGLGADAFRKTGLVNVELPDGVTEIPNGLFMGCDKLTAVALPESVTVIGENAFLNCSSLTAIDIPGRVERIGDGAFAFMPITEITLPEGLWEIGPDAFECCYELKTVYLPFTLQVIGYKAFYDCISLETFVFNGYMWEWENITKQFDWNKGKADYKVVCLDGSVVPGVTDENGVLYRINDQGTAYTLVNGDACKVENLVVPATINGLPVVEVGRAAFESNCVLKTVVLPDSITWIDDWAFNLCENLTTVTLPVTLFAIEDYAFAQCSSLNRINVNGTVSQWNMVSKASLWNMHTGDYTVYCTDGTVEKEILEW